MARFQNNPFPGVDASQHASWKKVILPSGEVYYEVPGHPGYVYDPVASNASGRVVYRTNPKGNIEKQQEQEEQIKKQQEQQEFNSSIQGQAIPVVLGTGGLIAAHELMKPGATAISLTKDGGVLMSDGSILGQTTSAAAPTAQTLGNAAAQGATGVQSGVSAGAGAMPGSAAGAGEVAALGENATAAPIGYAPYVGAAGAALGAYGLYNAIDQNDMKSGVLSGAGMGAGLAAAAPLVGLGPVGWGGLALAAGLGALGGGGLTAAFGHESTRDAAKRHTKSLMSEGEDDQVWQQYVAGMREQHNSAPPDPDKPFAGKYRTWDEYKKAGLQANDLTGVYGNLKAYGPAWASLTQAQREAVTQANIDSGLYYSNKGEVRLSDESKAKENYDNVMKGVNVGANAQAAAQAAQPPKPAAVVTPPAATTPPPVAAPPVQVTGPRTEIPESMKPFLKFMGHSVRRAA